MRSKANERQVGGQHYQGDTQHWDLSVAFGDRYLASCVSAYLTRWRNKNGLQDLEKAQHYMQKMMEETTAGRLLPSKTIPRNAVEFVKEYAEHYKLDGAQESIIYTVHTWITTAELGAARSLLDAYVQRQRQAARTPPEGDAGPAYVAQGAT